MRRKSKSATKAAARRAAKAATPPKKRAPAGNRLTPKTPRYYRGFDGRYYESVDLTYPPPLEGDPPRLAWPRISAWAWTDLFLTQWPTEDILQRLETFNIVADPETFRRIGEERLSAEEILKNWPTSERRRADTWDDFPISAMYALALRWIPDIPMVDVVGGRLNVSPDELWDGEHTNEAAEFLLPWLKEAVRLLERVPKAERDELWRRLEHESDTTLDIFLPDYWDVLVKKDPDAMLAMRPVLSQVLADPPELLVTLIRVLALRGRRDDLEPLLAELYAGIESMMPLEVTVALRALVAADLEAESLKLAQALLPHADDPLSWEDAANVLRARLSEEEWQELAARHPQPEEPPFHLEGETLEGLAPLTDDEDEELDPEFDLDLWNRAKSETLAELSPSNHSYPEPEANPFRGVGRNDPCPCGSGRKFKKCHAP